MLIALVRIGHAIIQHQTLLIHVAILLLVSQYLIRLQYLQLVD